MENLEIKPYAIILKPDLILYKKIDLIKQNVSTFVKDSVEFLDHPPHLTIFVTKLENHVIWLEKFQDFVINMKKIRLYVNGWHTFNEITNSKKTLVCTINDLRILRNLQIDVINFFNQFRSGTLKKYSMIKNPALLENVNKFGFPFVGNVWIPHLTIGSFSKEDYKSIIDKKYESPVGFYNLEAISIIDISDNNYKEVYSYNLSD